MGRYTPSPVSHRARYPTWRKLCIRRKRDGAGGISTTPRPDSTYTKINGAWLSDAPYSVIHRIARAKNAKGIGAFCINWCLEKAKNIRIDTHKDNAPMLKLLDNLGFTYCGIIWLENGDERLAFQKIE